MPKKIPADCMPSCQNCSFFLTEPKEDLGFCRRYPPIVISVGEDEYDTTFPVVARDEWCGEFHRFVN